MSLIPKGHSFVKPYPQPELDGDLGLTSHDIARSLSTTPDVLRKAICNSKFEKYAHDARLNIRRILRKSDGRGRPEQVYIFDAEAAKVLVARYSSDLGFRYCHFLVRCEKVLMERLPELERALYEAIHENRRLAGELQKAALPRGRRGPKKGMVPVFMLEETLFPRFDDIENMPLKMKKVFVPRADLTHREILTNENISMTQCIDGMIRKTIKNQALIMYYELPAHARLKPAK